MFKPAQGCCDARLKNAKGLNSKSARLKKGDEAATGAVAGCQVAQSSGPRLPGDRHVSRKPAQRRRLLWQEEERRRQAVLDRDDRQPAHAKYDGILTIHAHS